MQDNLFSILIRFKNDIFAFTVDIKQIYRFIEISQFRYKYLNIFLKDSMASIIQVFQLITVSYGTFCAPYLDTKVIQQLDLEEKKDFPLA